MKGVIPVLLFFSLFLLQSCTNTFMGTVVVLSFKDFILYIFLAFIMAILISMLSKGNSRKMFWIWFILSLFLTPLAGFIYLLVIITSIRD